MKKYILSIMVMRGLCIGLGMNVQAAETDTGTADDKKLKLVTAEPLNFVEFEHSYINDKEPETNGLIYNDTMLLQDARTLSPDIARLSAGLSAAAYDRGCVTDVLANMGFRVEDDGASYTKDQNLTLLDNDHVAYTIARKYIQYNGKNYLVYCVLVKGTSENAAWYSNFNLGEAAEEKDPDKHMHEGFLLAASEVYRDLLTYFQKESECLPEGQGDKEYERIIWVTGHSRGAAVANILAGWFTEREGFGNPEHIFGYTFACPAVGKVDADDDTLTNIYNFNNIGDLIQCHLVKSFS